MDVIGGGQCTSNFVYHYQDARYFLGVAAHCFVDSDDSTYTSCPTPGAWAPGAVVTLWGRENEEYDGVLAYSSFHTMNVRGERDPAICGANDFALVEVSGEALAELHPAVLGFGGPVALASPLTYLVANDELLAYANSDTRPTWLLHGEGFECRGPFKRYTDSGWGVQGGPHTPPLVPGDSGGPVMDSDGNAIGALSILHVQVGFPDSHVETRWTNVPRALWYMYEVEGWAPTLVTWEEFEG